jgi:soluble lytic murein transglycosylase-like protein
MNRRLFIITPLMMIFFILVLSSFTGEGTVGLTTVLGALKGPGVEALSVNRPICISDALLRISWEHGISPKLVQAIIQVESRGNPKAVSPRGALGLMQLMPEVIKACQVADPFDPLANIRAGVRHLHYLLLQFSGNLPLALAAYNAGAGAVRQYGGIPPYPETRKYLQSVLKEYQSEGNELEMFVQILQVKLELIDNIHQKDYLVSGSNELFTFLQNAMAAPSFLRIP